MIASPVDLWQHLCSSAALELRLKGGRPGRDADIEDALRLALAVPNTAKSLEDWLRVDAAASSPSISTEQLLIAVLKSQGGYACMMQDILNLLIAADARQASHQLSIAFKFDDISDPLKATLEEFREAVYRIERVLEKRPKLPDSNRMWPLAEVIRSVLPGFPSNPSSGFPQVPTLLPTGHPEVDSGLADIAQLVSEFRAMWRAHGATRNEVGNAAHDLAGTDSDTQRLRGQMFAATDYWDVVVLAGAQEFSRRVRAGEMSPEQASEKLAEALSEIEWGTHWIEHTVQELLNILNLPAWRRRHELYSVWVGVQMLNVVQRLAPDVRFHPVDGVLSFEFGGSRLATFSWDSKQFDVWAELRSVLVGISSKRKKGIQPDFRVLQVSLTKSINAQTVYVLECKHYLNSSTSNFSQAAIDYARSCPSAVVHVVNHGPADEIALSEALPIELRSRARFVGDATPPQEAITQALGNAIREALFPGVDAPVADPPVVASPTAGSSGGSSPGIAQIHLEWDLSLDDMDLALHVLDRDGRVSHSVDFRHKGSLDAPPFAIFHKDIRHGPGIERIHIGAWHFDHYELVAYNYSKTGHMTPQSLSCSIAIDGALTRLCCPPGLDETCYEWKIARIRVEDGRAVVLPFRS